MSWAQDEVGAARLGDARRSCRLVRLVERLAEQPSASIPAACAGAAETKAAYRLLSHEAVGWSDVLVHLQVRYAIAGHRGCLLDRDTPL